MLLMDELSKAANLDTPFQETESVKDHDKLGNLTEEAVDLASQINLEMDSDDVQELPDFHNQELTMDELTEMLEQD
ncbi:hypothetical protein TNCV_1841951 [Trichonephila clavipes]|nr:hypothetical protein TNCV_1841951 [Trichonephila clavipes]